MSGCGSDGLFHLDADVSFDSSIKTATFQGTAFDPMVHVHTSFATRDEALNTRALIFEVSHGDLSATTYLIPSCVQGGDYFPDQETDQWMLSWDAQTNSVYFGGNGYCETNGQSGHWTD